MKFDGEYSGVALAGFLRSFDTAPGLTARLLARHHLERVDPAVWYPLAVILDLCEDLRRQAGDHALYTAALENVSRTAPLPPGTTLRALLPMMGQRYRLSVRGPDAGGIECSLDDDHGAALFLSTPIPCAANRGIIQGYCQRCGERALIEHGAGGCTDDGARTCVYLVSW